MDRGGELKTGIVYLVGAGPGDTRLLTLRAKELIERCEVLVYDNLVNRRFLEWTSPQCERIDVGKTPGRHTVEQGDINQILVDKATDGLEVVRLKGGDPFVFGRCAEEMLALEQASVRYEVVPGVTAALACAAYAGIPLSHREYGSSISFLTGHEDVSKESLRVDFRRFAEVGGTLCIYMGMSKLEEIVEKLILGGLSPDRPAAVVSHGSLPKQRKVLAPLKDLARRARLQGLCAPAVVFVGNSVGLAHSSWFEKAPLFGRRIVLTRPAGQGGEMRSLLERSGAEVLEIPLIKVISSQDRKVVTEAFAGIATYEWVVFTSANGAREFMNLFFRAFSDVRSFGPMRIACVGDATAAVLRSHHLQVELVAENSTSENLAKQLIATDSLESANVLVVTGNRNREVLVEMLESVGRAIVDSLPVYETDFADALEAPDLEDFRRFGADAIVFTSSSTVLSYVEQEEDLSLSPDARHPILCSFGPQTSASLRENGLSVDFETEQPSLASMLSGLIQRLGGESETRQ